MRRTFCDRCGGECVNTTGHFGGHVEHTTRQGEQVGFDEMPSVDLCRDCTAAVAEFAGLKVTPRELGKDGPGFSNTFEGGPVPSFDTVTVHGGAHYVGPDVAG